MHKNHRPRAAQLQTLDNVLHEEHELVGRFVSYELAEGVDEQVETEEAHLNEQHGAVVVGLELLRAVPRPPGLMLGPRTIHLCCELLTLHRETSTQETSETEAGLKSTVSVLLGLDFGLEHPYTRSCQSLGHSGLFLPLTGTQTQGLLQQGSEVHKQVSD